MLKQELHILADGHVITWCCFGVHDTNFDGLLFCHCWAIDSNERRSADRLVVSMERFEGCGDGDDDGDGDGDSNFEFIIL